MGEFDDAKRSCRRRLAGHNERRRKGSTHDPLNNPRNLSHQGMITVYFFSIALYLFF